MKDEDIILKIKAEKEYAINLGFKDWLEFITDIQSRINSAYDWFHIVSGHSKQAIKEYESKYNLKIKYYE